MMYLRNTMLFACLFALVSINANGQDAWKKSMLKGKITYHSVTTTKEFDYDGNIITKSESELTGSTDQILTFYPGRFQLMAKDPDKLKEFNEANIYHIFFGEVYDMEKSEPIRFPVQFSTDFKEWEKCDNTDNYQLTKTSKANGVSQATAAKTFLSMIQTRSQNDVDEDKMMTAGLNKFAQQIMAERKAQDIKAGKAINEDEYFIPAGLYNPETYGLFLFTNWWTADYGHLPVIKKHRFYDCSTKKWEEYTADKAVDLYISDNNTKLTENYDEDGYVGRFQYIGVPPEQLEAFIKNPNVPTTFIGGSYEYYKDHGSESETRTIISLTVSLKE